MESFTGVREFIENQKNEGNKIIKILPDGSEIVVDQITDVKCSINKAYYGTVIGDHVWIGQDVLVNKNTYIPDHCVVGARSLVSGKNFYSHCVLAGVPARMVRHNITWNRPAPHKLSQTSRQYQIDKRLAFEYRNEDEIKKGNRIICITEDGSEKNVDISYFANLSVHFTGQYSLIKIHESVTIKKSLNIKIDDGGYCYIGEKCKFSSSKIVMSKDSTFVMGKSCNVSNGTVVFYVNGDDNLEIIIGNNCIFATDIKLRASDQFPIYSLDNQSVEINKSEFGIHIGNRVLICESVKILKDVEIPDGCIIGIGSVVTKSNFCKNSLIAGVPAKICKINILWKANRT